MDGVDLQRNTATVNSRPMWVYDIVTDKFRSALTGKELTAEQLRDSIQHIIEGAKLMAAGMVANLEANEQSLDNFDISMGSLVAGIHILAAAAGTAGIKGAVTATEAELRATIASEQAHKARFLTHMKDTIIDVGGPVLGLLSLTGVRTQWAQRAASYMDKALMTFEAARYNLMVYLDYTEARRVEHPEAEHCNGCHTEAGKGFVAIRRFKLLGHEECGQWCQCTVEYRKTKVHYTEAT